MNETQLLPTDSEILDAADDFRSQYMHGGTTFDEFDEIGFARAVLAKWGTPAPVGVEPIGYLYCGGSYGDELADWEIVADQCQCDKLNEHHGALGKEAKLPIYTTPQPTKAVPPAGRGPEFDQFLSDVMTAAGLVTHGKQCKQLGERLGAAVMKLLVHGIKKGGQHGAE